MNYKEYLDELSEKFGYNDDLRKAIEITIPLLVSKYGEDSIESVLDLFRDVRIFATDDMGYDNRKRIAELMTFDINEHVKEKEGDNPYGRDSDPGAYYSFQEIYDKDMNVTGEVRWLVVADSKGNKSEDYESLFGTSINMPYFIHEINHAYAMRKPIYSKQGDKIISKHGMDERETVIEKVEGGYETLVVNDKNLMVEESINEMYTQEMLKTYFKVDDYSEVRTKLNKIGHVGTDYNAILIVLAEKMENVLKTENLVAWRVDNDMSIKKEFNELVKMSDIAKKYLTSDEPFAYLDETMFELFSLKSKMGYDLGRIDEYKKTSSQLMMNGFDVLCSYQNVKHNTISFEEYEENRNNFLGIKQEETMSQVTK